MSKSSQCGIKDSVLHLTLTHLGYSSIQGWQAPRWPPCHPSFGHFCLQGPFLPSLFVILPISTQSAPAFCDCPYLKAGSEPLLWIFFSALFGSLPIVSSSRGCGPLWQVQVLLPLPQLLFGTPQDHSCAVLGRVDAASVTPELPSAEPGLARYVTTFLFKKKNACFFSCKH